MAILSRCTGTISVQQKDDFAGNGRRDHGHIGEYKNPIVQKQAISRIPDRCRDLSDE
jgi:hypothetical protein